MNAIGEGEPTFRECGTFTDHGFGFHAQDGTRTDYVIGWPFEDGSWAVLTGSYDLESDELADYHLPEDYLNGLLSRYGYSSLADFKSVNGEAWARRAHGNHRRESGSESLRGSPSFPRPISRRAVLHLSRRPRRPAPPRHGEGAGRVREGESPPISRESRVPQGRGGDGPWRFRRDGR